jgi:nucleotide-binding universal stress UspA family protein
MKQRGGAKMVSTPVKRMLVPTDFSDCSQAAVEYAVSLAKDFQAQVFLLHVMEPPVYGLDFSLMHPGVLPNIRHKLVEMMQQCVDQLGGEGVEAAGDFVIGVPSVEIIKAAKKREADLIVMGTHGRTGLSHIMLGSTAERVIQRAHCPVLTVKAIKPPLRPAEKEETVMEGSHPTIDETPVSKGETFCHLCGQPSQEIICEACKIRVQAEALERKQRIEKEGRVETGRR